jgi:asparagine synthase (glutamine-hydrolysing)
VCGICGKLNFDCGATVPQKLLKAMADTIEHRGPDDEGYYVSGPVGFGFRRLSIIDLKTGHQPICNENGTVWIVFNGEIYNYKELREDLLRKGHIFRSRTDTEVIVHLYEEFGDSCVDKLRGMFAFAIWDDCNHTLLLARDRVGIKPLYYRLTDSSISFGSEIKAILADPEVESEVEPEMIDRFLTFYYLPGEETLFHNIRKVAPGTCLVVKNSKARVKQYWDLRFAPVWQDIKSAQDELLALLEESVQLHMISDVPVGFLLSGGVDSTAMLAFAVGKTAHKLSSYTIGFSGSGVPDERPYARKAASRYGSEHHDMTMGPKEFVDFLPKYISHMEEPVCEPPALALYYVSRLAKEFVKVLISGEGGDEAFAGYPNYRSMVWLERVKRLCGPMSRMLSGFGGLLAGLPGFHRLYKYAPLLSTPFASYYYSRTSTPFSFFNTHMRELYTDDFVHLSNKSRSAKSVAMHLRSAAASGILNRMLYVDTKTWLPDDLLIKADKMTMANSVELRVPFLDHKLLEFAASLPESYKVRRFTTKYIAKKALSHKVPHEILQGKKTGFPVPYETWLRTELKDWVRDLLLDSKTLARGYFNRECIEYLLRENLHSGRYAKEVFSLALLELWHREFLATDKTNVRKGAFEIPAHGECLRETWMGCSQR